MMDEEEVAREKQKAMEEEHHVAELIGKVKVIGDNADLDCLNLHVMAYNFL
jgi:hypothetical protein